MKRFYEVLHGEKIGRWVTIDGRPVFMGGPSSGSGTATAPSGEQQVEPGTPWEFPRDKRRIPQEGEQAPKGYVYTGWGGWVSLSGAAPAGKKPMTFQEMIEKRKG